ncbi:MAG: spore coat associated protein CotJA [Oscillospiraceae bacterium]|nr:spore coat associated protein CotJA [Oscillospiraceae bacterium]
MSEMNNSSRCFYPVCGCVAYGYVPVQEMNDVYDVCMALNQGTVFPELDLNICEYGKICKQWGGGMNG